MYTCYYITQIAKVPSAHINIIVTMICISEISLQAISNNIYKQLASIGENCKHTNMLQSTWRSKIHHYFPNGSSISKFDQGTAQRSTSCAGDLGRATIWEIDVTVATNAGNLHGPVFVLHHISGCSHRVGLVTLCLSLSLMNNSSFKNLMSSAVWIPIILHQGML